MLRATSVLPDGAKLPEPKLDRTGNEEFCSEVSRWNAPKQYRGGVQVRTQTTFYCIEPLLLFRRPHMTVILLVLLLKRM